MVEGQEAWDAWTSTTNCQSDQRGCQREDKKFLTVLTTSSPG